MQRRLIRRCSVLKPPAGEGRARVAKVSEMLARPLDCLDHSTQPLSRRPTGQGNMRVDSMQTVPTASASGQHLQLSSSKWYQTSKCPIQRQLCVETWGF